jgi:glycosyltransferase involved in cell wall biosynthesis
VAAKLWIDVEDLFEYARSSPRPSGIQRLAFEIYKVLQVRSDASEFVRFVRHDSPRDTFRVVQWAEVKALFADLAETVPELAQTVLPGAILPHAPARQLVRKLVHRLPPSLRAHVIDVMLTQSTAFHAWWGLVDALARGVLLRLAAPFRLIWAPAKKSSALAKPAEMHAPECRDAFGEASSAGDILLVLGSPWSHPDYARLMRAQRLRGLKFVLLVYDLIPLLRPEWFDRGLVRIFRSWFDSIFPLCDHVFAISQATAQDVELYARERGIALSAPVTAVPIGTSFGAANVPVPAPRTWRLPEPGSYTLIVSTIEPRKNHQLLFRVWRRMLEELPRESVPTLVFAGRIGWLSDDLMQQIANTNNLDGKLVWVENPTDAELVALYEGCLFSLFPSFYEGWGLPVTESLALGKPCLTSNRSSLPEAGGNLARRFDPDDLNDAYRAIREAIDDRPGLARWEAQIRREFKPISWTATADAILTALNHPMAPGKPMALGVPMASRDDETEAASLVRSGAR